jgi:hypothetical protein
MIAKQPRRYTNNEYIWQDMADDGELVPVELLENNAVICGPSTVCLRPLNKRHRGAFLPGKGAERGG